MVAVTTSTPHPQGRVQIDPDLAQEMKAALWEKLTQLQRPWQVFAYGSLMWNPGFSVVQTRLARLDGWRRSFCVYSHRYRGTAEKPGLVLGLDQGGSCTGFALEIVAADCRSIFDYLWEREMVTGAYQPLLVPLDLGGGEAVTGLTFVARADHRQYAGHLAVEEAAHLIASASGERGSNIAYFQQTVALLDRHQIEDPWLQAYGACLAQY